MSGLEPPRSIPFDAEAFRWRGVEPQVYKFSQGEERGMGWRGVTRFTIASPKRIPARFELRYFELEPGGYSRLEKHRHVHCVVALRGAGRALVGDEVFELGPLDAIYVAPLTPHRWINAGEGPFGFLCPVDGDRDTPIPLDEAEWDSLRANPRTAPYVY
jgi:quercetin dioxygenase-like cupin family protein